jgi:GH24 family phage-related lysozyme (muramidase)
MRKQIERKQRNSSCLILPQGKLVELNNMLENTVVLNNNQYGALVELMFNIKPTTLANSDLIGRLNDGEDPGMQT